MPATGAGIYLNAGSAGPIPAETQRAMDEQSARELAVGRASGDQFAMVLERQAELRAAIAAVLVADPDDIAITHSTTDGMNLAVNALAVAVRRPRRHHAARAPGRRRPAARPPRAAGRRDRLRRHRRRRRRRGDPRGARGGAAAAGAGGRPEPRPVDDRRRPADRADRAPRPGRGRGHDRRCRAGRGRDPGQRRGSQHRGLRGARTEVAPGARGDGGPVGAARLGTQRGPAVGGLHLVRDPRPAGARPVAACPSLRGRVLPPPVRHRPCAQLRVALDVRRPAVGAGAGRAARAAAADRLAAIDGVELVTPRANMATLVTFRKASWYR